MTWQTQNKLTYYINIRDSYLCGSLYYVRIINDGKKTVPPFNKQVIIKVKVQVTVDRTLDKITRYWARFQELVMF